jgi:hypothetical protein
MVPEAKKSVGAIKVSPGELIILLRHPLKRSAVKRNADREKISDRK